MLPGCPEGQLGLPACPHSLPAVRETLLMAAELRMGGEAGPAEKEGVVDGIISRLGLAKASSLPRCLQCCVRCCARRRQGGSSPLLTLALPHARTRPPGRQHAGGRRQDARPERRREEAAFDRHRAHLPPRARLRGRADLGPGRVCGRKGAVGWWQEAGPRMRRQGARGPGDERGRAQRLRWPPSQAPHLRSPPRPPQVMGTLRELCSDGHTVVVSIHQPRSSVFAMFDDLVLLSGGWVGGVEWVGGRVGGAL